MEIDFKKIGRKISEARIKQNKTQEVLSEKVGISPMFLSNIENGKRNPSIETLILIAKELKVSLDYLILDEDLDKEINENIYMKEIYKKIEHLDTTSKEDLLDIIILLSEKLQRK